MSKRTGTKVQKNRTDDEFIMLPTVDFCFKELMRNEKVRKGIIAALLGVRPEEIKETRLLPTILRKEYEDDKFRNASMSVFWILYISRRITGAIGRLHFVIQKREKFIQMSWRFMCWNWGSYHRKIRMKKES